MRTVVPATLALFATVQGWFLTQGIAAEPNRQLARPEIAEPTTADDGLRKALGYLETRGMAWMRERKCASCHHVPMMIWTMHEAQRHGFTVNKDALAEVTAFALADDNRAKLLANADDTGPAAKALSVGAVYAMLALQAADKIEPSQRGVIERLAKHIRERQGTDGAWPASTGDLIPPINDSQDITTILATLALESDTKTGATVTKGETQEDRLGKTLRWLAAEKKRAESQAAETQAAKSPGEKKQPDEHHQLLVLQLVLQHRLNNGLGKGPSQREVIAASAKQLLAMQNPDGGWSQTRDMPSDAFATGQTLYALSLAGLPPGHEAIRQARSFLGLRQNADGSWPMTSRPRKSTGKAAKFLEPITYAGTAWGAIGLLRTSDPAPQR